MQRMFSFISKLQLCSNEQMKLKCLFFGFIDCIVQRHVLRSQHLKSEAFTRNQKAIIFMVQCEIFRTFLNTNDSKLHQYFNHCPSLLYTASWPFPSAILVSNSSHMERCFPEEANVCAIFIRAAAVSREKCAEQKMQ